MKKGLKLIVGSVLFSFVLSIILGIINYVPASERQPNVYELSMMDHLVFGMVYFTPIILAIVLSLYGSFTILGKLTNQTTVVKVIESVLLTMIVLALAWFIFNRTDETNDIYLIPEDFEGDVYAIYNVAGAPKVKTEDGFSVHEINDQGYFVTSTPDLDYGTVTDRYYYVDEGGKRTPIESYCVSSFGTGGHSEEIDGKAVNLHYTGVKVTKAECGEVFMHENFGLGDRLEEVLEEVLRKYYREK